MKKSAYKTRKKRHHELKNDFWSSEHDHGPRPVNSRLFIPFLLKESKETSILDWPQVYSLETQGSLETYNHCAGQSHRILGLESGRPLLMKIRRTLHCKK